jgi:hypothetical protein
MTVSEKLINSNQDEIATLNFIHDYLESRTSLLKSIRVSCFLFVQLSHFQESLNPFSG